MTQKRQILITGTTKGLGDKLARHFLDEGDIVFGCARSPTDLTHDNYHHFCLDVTDAKGIKEVFFRIRQDFGRLDALINNVGIASMNAFALTPLETARKIMEVNYFGTFSCSQRAIGLLRKSKAPRIINLSTVAVPLNLEGEAAYAASKSAVETLTRIMAKELGGFGITCNAVGPSPIATDLIKGVGEEKIQKLIQAQAIKRMATPQDVINVVEFFLRPESGMITGQTIYLGGIS
ncbi:SDR family NAD(P)-dependent oxidoreductase [Desulforhabdus sp. TSK]|uniref:SDR family NAD(P)-dependent oxidoreductase n=1 Tax=Desulforhabdus sp. TSK TaxID=2925014 RepID=UPI001FC7E1A3|nr:SDR family oxidoreductase [Desulforhabdus sp. TSK]GKT07862.1 oxidoreductase [Desulforhabdus sp. TSK]